MRKVQYVSQKPVKEFDIVHLNDREQDEFIKEVGQMMAHEMQTRTASAMPLGEVGFLVTGPHDDPLQGKVHVHTISAWFDLDQMAADAPFRLDFLATLTDSESGETPLS